MLTRICYLNNVNTNIFSWSHAINPSPRTMSLISRGENFEASEYYKDVHPLYTTHGQKAWNLIDMLVCVLVWDWFYLKIATILKWPPPSFSTWSQARWWSPEGERRPWVKVNRGKGAHQSGRNWGPTRRAAPCKYFCLNKFFIYNLEICLLQTSV